MIGILLDDTGDLSVSVERASNGVITSGLQTGDCDNQLIERILVANPGQVKESPTSGADIYSQMGGITDPFWEAATKKMLTDEGLNVSALSITNKTVTITTK